MTPLQSLLKNALIIIALLILKNLSTIVNTKFNLGFFISLSSISIIAILLYFPIYTWLNVNPKPNKTVPFEFTDITKMNNGVQVELNKGKKVIGVFNMACDHCHEMAFKFGILAQENKLQHVYLILVGENDEIVNFLSETHLNYPYKRFNFFEVVKKYPNITWPWILLAVNGETKKQWVYETFDVKNFMHQLK
jgi:NhaP-type Na+/H+ and K+/H+ antiporter